MPDYHVTTTVTWVQALDAENEEEAKRIVKSTFKEEFNFEPSDVEIINIEEQ